ncbi:hypothetical protein R3I93_020305 [Phoxinus phoxinus]|uniref:Uncharacterized protein n=1 Tax=Phoxinus phoxinus TaxID=58324 RepID=A0AAN9C9P4_9TELE
MQRPFVPSLTCQESSELCEKDDADEVFQRLEIFCTFIFFPHGAASMDTLIPLSVSQARITFPQQWQADSRETTL